jgi:type II secretory pathway component PulJ
METVAVLLLIGALGLGCMIFYVFLQFLHTSRQAEERQRQILLRLSQIERRLEQAAPANAPTGPPAP